MNEKLSHLVGELQVIANELKTSNRQIAMTILDQMGGQRRLVTMTGARNFISHPRGLSFQFPNKTRSKANFVKVTLDPTDTYTVEFGRTQKFDYRKLKEYHDVYGDQLVDLFERETGLYLRF